ncbi:MAG TPA: hypothetical protein PKA82_08870 [Pyrinomonadaceae bacterium]|nr:hypothetical protein [Pyrinomonadaceae bacterium]
MFKNLVSLKVLVFAVSFFALATIADAQATRTWVSGVGDDVNPCSRTAPCKTFAGAISKTATNGEINCLDPAGYGAVTVTKSITIDCEDTQGSILSAGTNGVIVNITAAADTKKAFKIRGISINGAGTGINGIRVLAANTVDVDEVVIDGVTQHGISLETTAGTVKVSVDKTTIRSNTGNGINSFITGGTMQVDVSNSRLSNNATGFSLSSNTKATISDSIINGNTTGLVAASSTMGVIRCTIANNTTGISSLAGGSVRFSASMITANNTGLSSSGGGLLISHISNVLNGNTVDGAPTSSVVLQ